MSRKFASLPNTDPKLKYFHFWRLLSLLAVYPNEGTVFAQPRAFFLLSVIKCERFV